MVSTSFSSVPRHFRTAESPWVAYKRAADCHASNRPSWRATASSRPLSAASFSFPKRSTKPTIAGVLRFNIRSEEHTSELQSRFDLVCRLLLEKKKKRKKITYKNHRLIKYLLKT